MNQDITGQQDAMSNHIISVGSVDGILTTAALSAVLHEEHEEWPTVSWCQAFTADRVELPSEPARIYLVDLAVNNRDPQMTRDFVERIDAGGHRLVGVADEHDAGAWRELLGAERFDALEIQPLTRGDVRPGEHPDYGIRVGCSGDCLIPWLTRRQDARTRALWPPDGRGNRAGFTPAELLAAELVNEATSADRGDFGVPPARLGRAWGVSPRWLANAAVKPAITDDSRRTQLVRYFSGQDTRVRLLAVLLDWAADYEAMQRTADQIVADRDVLGEGIWRIDTTDRGPVDITSLCMSCYDAGARVLVTRCSQRTRDDATVAPRSVFSAPSGGLQLLEILQGAGISCGGAPFRVTLDRADEDAGIAAVRAALEGGES